MSYDSRSPALGVRVAPMVKGGWEKHAGLSMAQSKAARFCKGEFYGYKQGGPFSAGVGVRASIFKGTRSPYQYKRKGEDCARTPGRKGPGPVVKPKKNPIFRNPLPKKSVIAAYNVADAERVARNAYQNIKREHAGLIGAGADGDVKHYAVRREMFLEQYPTMRARLEQVENEHKRSIVPGLAGRGPMDNTHSDRQTLIHDMHTKCAHIRESRKASKGMTFKAEPQLLTLPCFKL